MENTENKFKHDGLWYIAVEESSCRGCEFRMPNHCILDLCADKSAPLCSKPDRQDNRNVIFVRSDVDNLGYEE